MRLFAHTTIWQRRDILSYTSGYTLAESKDHATGIAINSGREMYPDGQLAGYELIEVKPEHIRQAAAALPLVAPATCESGRIKSALRKLFSWLPLR